MTCIYILSFEVHHRHHIAVAEIEAAAEDVEVGEDNATIFVKNLSFETTEDDLHALFSEVGTVRYEHPQTCICCHSFIYLVGACGLPQKATPRIRVKCSQWDSVSSSSKRPSMQKRH